MLRIWPSGEVKKSTWNAHPVKLLNGDMPTFSFIPMDTYIYLDTPFTLVQERIFCSLLMQPQHLQEFINVLTLIVNIPGKYLSSELMKVMRLCTFSLYICDFKMLHCTVRMNISFRCSVAISSGICWSKDGAEKAWLCCSLELSLIFNACADFKN